ncbi:hypothetical protein [Algicella marina]|uniref:Uncharacterized protein n=1 Tax=Algicella marina TaxID=2683284 RepID=A0A6P1T3V3_9RHOB|nr:hypothetical protein [Algicella marina]QHQ36687.1 hypothetical protein GO499_16660 [Algicella marina]
MTVLAILMTFAFVSSLLMLSAVRTTRNKVTIYSREDQQVLMQAPGS